MIFFTICTKDKESYFGTIEDGEMILNEFGRIAQKCYLSIPEHFPFVILDEFVIMPNHIHGIIIINNDENENIETKNVETKNFSSLQQGGGQQNQRGTSKTIGSIVRGFKIGVTKYMRENTQIYQIWQPNYYDRIIRNEQELQKIRKYIVDNPLRWEFDKENKENLMM